MKNGVLALGVFTAGIFMGVGFLSGKETALFFMPYKFWVVGLILNALLTGVFSIVIIAYFKRFDGNDKLLNTLGFLLSFLIISVTVSGASEVICLTFKASKQLVSLALFLLVFLVNLKGLKLLSKASAITVPLFIILLFICYIISLFKRGYQSEITVDNCPISPFLPNVTISSLVYAGYNLACAIKVFKANKLRFISPKKTVFSTVIAISILLILSLLIAFIISGYSAMGEAVPTIYSVKEISLPLYFIMIVLIIVSALSLTATHLTSIVNSNSRYKKAIVLLLAYLSNLVGFSRLISIVYPIIGALGVGVIIYLFIKLLKQS